MKARPASAEIQGFYCPLQPPRLVARRLASGKCILTNLGLEKECPKCKCHWPMDTEYWFASKTGDGLFSWCRACYTERRWPTRGAPPAPAHRPRMPAFAFWDVLGEDPLPAEATHLANVTAGVPMTGLNRGPGL